MLEVSECARKHECSDHGRDEYLCRLGSLWVICCQLFERLRKTTERARNTTVKMARTTR
jgi:hypothetical protein